MSGRTHKWIMMAMAALVWSVNVNGGEVVAMESVKNNTAAAFVAKEIAAGHRPNRLIGEKSPYLLQHAFNPVDWHPWGEAAFAEARHDNKPIFLSIGYSTCHWCHVMERESFEDTALAAILNRYFVCIKVDREERPDLDQVYMTVTQAMTGSGGWPMSLFLTPDLKPFYAGTYFPPQGAYGRPGFADLLEKIHDAWQRDHEKIGKQAAAMMLDLSKANAVADTGGGVGDETLSAAAGQLTRGYDQQNGGFGGAPKFPRPVAMSYLLRYGQRTGNGQVLDMVYNTLRKMAGGGVYDQLGGGFHRYAVDAAWRVPHFEKMLYDQAQLASLYLEAAQLSHDPFFKEVAARTLDYVLTSMRDGGGGFYSAEDADSPLPDNPEKQGEGAYYLWTDREIGSILDVDEAAMVRYRFGIVANGNAPDDPQGEFRGRNILYLAKGIAETAQHFKVDEARVKAVLASASQKMLLIRAKRPRPHLDDKVLCSWNGLMISALAKGYLVLGKERYLTAAEQAAGFLRQRMMNPADHRLWHRFRDGEAGIAGLLEDYAFTVQGFLDLYEASFDWRWLELALKLTETQITLFEDTRNGGFFETSGQDKSLIMRIKSDYDGAEPSGNSVAALNLLRLGRILRDDALLTRAAKTINAFGTQLHNCPSALPQMLSACEFKRQKPAQIVIAGDRGAADTKAMQHAVAEFFLPNKIMLLTDGSPLPPAFAEKLSALTYMTKQGGKATAYLCENFACRQPTTNVQTLRELLIK
jgi:uncharacterized protein YyaL (SSP411 family)